MADSSELVEVKVEELDDTAHHPSLQSPGAFNAPSSTSAATNTGIATSGATFSGAPATTITTSSQPDVLITHPPFIEFQSFL